MAPLIRKVDGTIDPLDEDIIGPPFGVVNGYKYKVEKRIIEPGDTIAIVTDGVYEARSPEGEFYGMERIFELVRRDGCKAEVLAKALLADVHKHVNDQPQNDDVTIMAIGRVR